MQAITCLLNPEIAMKKLAAAALVALLSQAAIADTYVQGYMRSDGTYVPGHYRSSPNNSRADNYGSLGSSQSTLTHPSMRDSDGDGITNRYDTDDNNNGRHDNYE